MKTKPVKGSLASTTKDGKATCDLEKLAKILLDVGQVPERINLIKATEISLMS